MELITEAHENLKPRLNVLDVIFERRAIRSYLPKKVMPDLLEELLTATTQAPSALNKQDILRTEEFRNDFGTPENYIPVLPTIVGYAAGKAKRTVRNSAKILKWVYSSKIY
jgi:hypothetical protein